MGYLVALDQLEDLYLIDTSVDDEGLVALGKLRALQDLCLNGTLITDRGLEYLKESPRLHRVDCQKTKVTDAALEALLSALPGRIELMREMEQR